MERRKKFGLILVNSHTLLIILVWASIFNWANGKCSDDPPLPSSAHFSQQPQHSAQDSVLIFLWGVEELEKGRWALIVLYHKHFTGKETEISTNGVLLKAHPQCPLQQLRAFSSAFQKRKGQPAASLFAPASMTAATAAFGKPCCLWGRLKNNSSCLHQIIALLLSSAPVRSLPMSCHCPVPHRMEPWGGVSQHLCLLSLH